MYIEQETMDYNQLILSVFNENIKLLKHVKLLKHARHARDLNVHCNVYLMYFYLMPDILIMAITVFQIW